MAAHQPEPIESIAAGELARFAGRVLRSVTLHKVTYTHNTMKRAKAALGELENSIMQLVWTHDELTAERVRELLASDLKEATVRTVLRRLEEKGYLSHTLRERTFVYTAAASRSQVAARAVKRVVDWICGGSVEEVLIGMVDTKMVDRETIAKLSRRIEQAGKSNRAAAGNPRKGK